MSFSRQQWVGDFLKTLGNSAPTGNCILFVCGWSAFETGSNLTIGAKFNLLNTTQTLGHGETNFNSVGVKNYVNYGDGINANVTTLKNGRYPDLLNAVLHNSDALLQNPSQAMINQLGTWGTGYKTNFITLGQARQNDVANYGTGTAVTGVNNVPSVADTNPPQYQPDDNPIIALSQAVNRFNDNVSTVIDPVFIGKVIIGGALVAIGTYLVVKG